MNDNFCLIILAHLPYLGFATINFILKLISVEHISLSELLNLTPQKRRKLFPQLSLRIHSSLDNWKATADRVKDLLLTLRNNGIFFKSVLDRNYPLKLKAELGNQAPPVIFYKGNWRLLKKPGIAVVGTRQPTLYGQRATYSLVHQLARHNVNIISGMARGIDTIAHLAALKASGATTLVLTHGILRFHPSGQLKQLLTSRNSLALSAFPPEHQFLPAYAIQRNYLLAALADSLLVGETRLRGGSAYAIRYFIKNKKPLFAIVYPPASQAHKGSSTLVSSGATPLKPYKLISPRTLQWLLKPHQ